jgi:hypothetical protein
MVEKILKIEEKTFEGSRRYYDGFFIITDKQTIKIGISNMQDCCENWGYFMTTDELGEFIGADLLSVDIVDKCLNKKKLEDRCGLKEGEEVMFVNFETSEGTLQFTAYNEHNGYYGHEAVIVSNQLTKEECL